MQTVIPPVLAFSIIAVIILITIVGFVKSKGLENKTRFAIVLAMIAFSIFSLGFTVGFWRHIGLEKPADSIYQLTVVLLFVVVYRLMALSTIAIVKWKEKKDFLKVEGGLLSRLRKGLIGGLIIGIIAAIIIEYFVKPGIFLDMLIVCPAIGLIFGYILGTFLGYKNEFEE